MGLWEPLSNSEGFRGSHRNLFKPSRQVGGWQVYACYSTVLKNSADGCTKPAVSDHHKADANSKHEERPNGVRH
jgi:hypothetical protein